MAWQLHNMVTPTAAESRSLLFSEMESLQAHSTMQEADELIRRWLAGVESATAARLHLDGPEAAHVTGEAQSVSHVMGETQSASDEFLSSVDWISGDVGQSTKSILRGLLSKNLDREIERQTTPQKKACNPLVTMEMRHKEVKHRRDLREQKRREKEERRKMSELAHKEARALVMEEERRAKARAEKEERMIELQMKTLRKELRERERLVKQLALEKSLVEEEEGMEEKGKDEAVMMEAERFVASERKRVTTRMELTRQLEEAELKETKENVKLLHQCFQGWWGEVMRGRGKLAKAIAVRDWRLVLSVWKAWAWFVRENRERRAREELARWLQREKMMTEVAVEHSAYRMLKRCLEAWHRLTRRANTERRQKEAQQSYRAKMAAFLEVASAKVEKQRIGEKEVTRVEKQITSSVGQSTAEGGGGKEEKGGLVMERQVAVKRESRQHQEQSRDGVVKDGENVAAIRSATTEGSGGGEGGRSHVSKRPSKKTSSSDGGVIWKKAKSQLNDLLSQVEAPPTTSPTTRVGVVQPRRPKPRPVTKQLAMTAAMERRSAEIAERRLAREQRREALLREKVELLAKEEEEQRKAEVLEREARLKQKREEKRLAKLKELEKLSRQKALAELTDKAIAHYRMASMKWRGLEPWRKFLREMKKQQREADKLREKVLMRKSLSIWHSLTLQREQNREYIAVGHYQKHLLRTSLAAWMKVRELSCELEAMADHHCPRLLLQRSFRGWYRVVREKREEEWEKMARARRFRQRQVQCVVLRAWHAFVPLAKEERERERRKADMRRKVASWLNDYQPSASPANHVEQLK